MSYEMSNTVQPSSQQTIQPTMYPPTTNQPTMYPPTTNQPTFIIGRTDPDFPVKIPRRQFTHGLCDCCGDCGECCCAYLCPCIYQIQIFARAGEGCCSCVYGGLVPLRTKVRTERGIEGSICGDFCAIVWCPFCALVQLGRELKDTEPLIKIQ